MGLLRDICESNPDLIKQDLHVVLQDMPFLCELHVPGKPEGYSILKLDGNGCVALLNLWPKIVGALLGEHDFEAEGAEEVERAAHGPALKTQLKKEQKALRQAARAARAEAEKTVGDVATSAQHIAVAHVCDSEVHDCEKLVAAIAKPAAARGGAAAAPRLGTVGLLGVGGAAPVPEADREAARDDTLDVARRATARLLLELGRHFNNAMDRARASDFFCFVFVVLKGGARTAGSKTKAWHCLWRRCVHCAWMRERWTTPPAPITKMSSTCTTKRCTPTDACSRRCAAQPWASSSTKRGRTCSTGRCTPW